MKLGCLPPKNAPSIKFSSIINMEAAAALPPHPVSVDYLTKFPAWEVLGNDQYGDCVAVTWANERRVLTALAGSETYPGMDQVVAVYKTQNPGFPAEDNGMDIQTVLEYLVKEGGPDGVKPLAFAKVDHANLEEVKAALAVFGMLWTGVTVRAVNMDQFRAGQPWDYDPQSAVDGGHSIMSGGYLGQGVNDVRFVTWGQETGFTDSFWQNQVDQAWVVIWPEHLGTTQFQQGIDLATLANDYIAITGRQLPINPPSPAPAPATGATFLGSTVGVDLADLEAPPT